MIGEFVDDPEAWKTILTTMRQHMRGLASHMNVGIIMQGNGNMTLGQMLSLLPHADELPTVLEVALAGLGREGMEGTGSE